MAKTAARLIVGISGASGTIYGVRLLEMLRKAEIETHLVMSKSAEMTMVYETDFKPKDVRALASVHYPVSDIGAAISSGSFPTMGMIIAPCSIRTMSEIATGVTSSLLSRAADVVLKEKRRLVLAVRETPLHGGHLRTMTTLADIGAVIAPIVPAFYNRPKSVDDIINHTCGRLLDLFGIDTGMVKRWKGGPAEDIMLQSNRSEETPWTRNATISACQEAQQVLGDAYVDRALQNVDDFNRDFQRLLTEYCWGETWGDETLKPRERSILNLGMIGALGKMEEFATHVRGALNNGLTPNEIRAALTQIMIYCGAPIGVDCFRVAKPIIAEHMKNKK